MPQSSRSVQLALRSALTLAALFLGARASAQFYDGSNVTFGKNRVQYQEFFWMHYPMGTFDVYFYPGGQDLAQQVGQILPSARARVEQLFDRTLEGPIQVIVYTDHEAFRQSNIGAQITEENNIGGTATLIGTKLFVHGTGDASELEASIRAGLARVLFNQILFGGNWQDALRNNTLISFPEWFSEGLFSYAARPWSAEMAATVWDHARSGAFERIELSGSLPAGELGHGVWKYVVDIFGEPVVANILYMARVSKTMEGGFQFATGLGLDELLAEVTRYHLRSAESLTDLLPPLEMRADRRVAKRDAGELPVRLRLDRNLIAWSRSPSGTTWAYATEERSQIRVATFDPVTGEHRRIGKHGHRIDRSTSGLFPVFAWHPEGNLFAYTLESKGAVQLVTVDLDRGEEAVRDIADLDGIRAMDFSPDGRTILFTGLRGGASDLYIYQLVGNTQRALWRDGFDDLDGRYSADGRSVVFASNRPGPAPGDPESIARPGAKLDVYAVTLGDDLAFTRLTETPDIDERLPQPMAGGRVTYLAESTDHQQERIIAWRDSVVQSIDTAIHYRYFTQTQVAESLTAPVTDFTYLREEDAVIYAHELMGHPHLRKTASLVGPSGLQASQRTPAGGSSDWVQDWGWKPGVGEVDFRNYVFGPLGAQPSDEEEEPMSEVRVEGDQSGAMAPATVLPKASNYRLNYAIESVTSQLDNTFNSAFYQPYDGVVSAQPGIGGLTRVSMSDLFEDRRFIAGFRLSGNLGNSQYAFSYSDLSKRMDRTVSLSRQGQQRISSDNRSLIETHIHTLRYRLSYPLDEVRSVRLEAIYRFDRAAYLTTDAYNLALPSQVTNQIGGVLSYVHDATRERDLNLRDGTRYKLWGEFYLNTDAAQATFGTAGFDFRHYQPIYRDFLFAIRAAGNWSIGRDRLLHLLGGVDNVLSLTANSGTPIDPDVPYAYQTRITPLRGFRTNARNGSNLALVNAELRLPMVTTFTRRPIPTDFLRHLQAVGFLDCGSAWNGTNPYTDENGFNFQVVTANPITVTIDNNHEPILWSMGYGLRTRLMGYWVRADWGYGVDDGRWQKRVFNFSFSLDF